VRGLRFSVVGVPLDPHTGVVGLVIAELVSYRLVLVWVSLFAEIRFRLFFLTESRTRRLVRCFFGSIFFPRG